MAIEFAAAAIAFHSESMVEVEDPPSSYDMIILSESMLMCHHTMYYTMNFFHTRQWQILNLNHCTDGNGTISRISTCSLYLPQTLLIIATSAQTSQSLLMKMKAK